MRDVEYVKEWRDERDEHLRWIELVVDDEYHESALQEEEEAS